MELDQAIDSVIGESSVEPLRQHAQNNIHSGNTVRNEDGSISTVRSGSVRVDELNGGKPTLIPFVWDGKVVDEEEAISRAIQSGKKWPSFNTDDEATIASKGLSSSINVPRGTSRLDTAIESVIGDNNPAILHNPAAPDAAAKQYRLSRESGAPLQLVQRNEKAVQSQYDAQKLDLSVLQDTPFLAGHTKDPGKLAAIRDDLAGLSYFERWVGDLKQSTQKGFGIRDLGELYFKDFLGVELSPVESNQINLINQSMSNQTDYDIGFFASMPAKTMEMVPLMLEAIKDALPVGGAAATAGGTVGGIPGALAWGTIGQAYATAIQFGMAETGLAWGEFKNLRDENGQLIEQDTARGAALVVGVINGALEMTGFSAIAKQFPGAQKVFNALTRNAIKDQLKKNIGKQAMKEIGLGMMEVGAVNYIQEFYQEVTGILGKEILKLLSSGDFETFGGDDFMSWLVASMDQSLEAGKAAFQGAVLLGGVGSATNLAVDSYAQNIKYNNEQTQIEDLKQKVAENTTAKRDPQLFNEVTAETLGDQKVYINAEVAREFFQTAEAVNIDEVIKDIPEIREQLVEALKQGGDLVLPANKVALALNKHKGLEALQPEMRLTPESLTDADYDDTVLNTVIPEVAREVVEGEASQFANDMERNITDQIMAAGNTEQTARTYAQNYRAFYERQRAWLAGNEEALQQLDQAFEKITVQAGTVPQEGAMFQVQAFHGSSELFNKFALEKIGTGQGAQTYGYGLYFAESPDVAGTYQRMDFPKAKHKHGKRGINKLNKILKQYEQNNQLDEAMVMSLLIDTGSPKYVRQAMKTGIKPQYLERIMKVTDQIIKEHGDEFIQQAEGNLYNVRINVEEEELLDWDKPISSNIAKKIVPREKGGIVHKQNIKGATGAELYGMLKAELGDTGASKYLNDLGIHGIKYLDQFSRGARKDIVTGWRPMMVEGKYSAKNITTGKMSPTFDTKTELNDWIESRAGTSNFVIFDDSLIEIVNVNGKPLKGQERQDAIEEMKPPEKDKTLFQRGIDKAKSMADDEYLIVNRLLQSFMAKHKDLENTQVLEDIGALSDIYDPVFGISEAEKQAGIKELETRYGKDVVKEMLPIADQLAQASIRDRAKPKELFQDTGEKKGSIQFPDGQTIITLFEGADASTLLHETGHFFLETQKNLAQIPGMPADYLAHWKEVQDWLGVKEDGIITTEMHEQFARAFEAYIMEGKAPSTALREAFRTFKAWLIRVYQDVRNLNVKLSQPVRALFDRMLATDEQIEIARNQSLFKPDQGVMEMLTAAERADYVRRNENAIQAGKEKLLRKLLKEKERENKAWWKSEREAMRKEVEDRVNRMPVYVALHFLKTGEILDRAVLPDLTPFKLDKKAVSAQFGAGMAELLPPGILGSQGADPAIAADLFGFESAGSMIQAMISARDKKQFIDAETDAAMIRAHGDILNDGTIEQQALDALHNSDRSGNIHYELEVITRQTGQPAAPREQFLQRARDILNTKTIDDAIRPARFYIAEVRAAREAGKALGQKDYTKAAEQKRKQLLNHYLYREATALRNNVTKTLKAWKKLQKDQVRGKVRMDEDYRLKIVEILDAYNLGSRLSEEKRSRLTNEALADWMARKETDDGAVFIEPAEINEADTKKHFRDMTVEEYVGIRDTVANIAYQGRNLRKLLIEGRRADLKEIAEEVSQTIYANVKKKKRRLQPRTGLEEMKHKAENFFFNTLKARTFIREMDGFKDLGTVHNYIMKAVDSAEVNKIARQKQASEEINQLFEKYYGHRLQNIGDMKRPVFIREINNSLTKDGILAVGLNWGNIDNRTKLLDGHGWSETQGLAILQHLTRNDWDFIQATWNYINSYWPEIAALEKSRAGVAPKKVAPDPFTIVTAEGDTIHMDGGYYPIKYDERLSAAVPDVISMEMSDIMKTGRFSRAQTRRGFTKARVTGVKYPIRLDMTPLFQHVNEVITDLTMSQAVENGYKILQSQAVKTAMVDTIGINAFRQLDMWLKDIAVGSVIAESTFDNVIDGLRAGASISVMGFKFSTIMIQATGIFQSMVRLGPKWLLRGLVKFHGDPTRMNQNVVFAYEKSKVMKDRSTTFHRDVYDTMRIMQKKGEIRGKIAEAGFWPIVKMQMMVDVPTWLGAYEKGLDQFQGDEDKAVEFADMALIQSQASGMMKDLSGFERGSISAQTRLSPMVRMWTVFYSYFNAKINLAYEQTKKTDFSRPTDIARLATDYAMLFWLEAVVGEMMLQRMPDFDEDDKDPYWWNIKMTLINMAATLPLMKEIAGGMQGFAAAPGGLRGLDEVARAMSTAARQVEKFAEGDDVDIIAVIRSLNAAAGILFKYPAAQINVALKAMKESMEGEDVAPIDYLLYRQSR